MSTLSPSNTYALDVASAAGNGNTTGVVVLFSPCELMIWGTFGGGTVKAQRSPDSTDGSNGTWIDIPNASWTAATTVVLYLGLGNRLRLAISGGSSPSINATASPA